MADSRAQVRLAHAVVAGKSSRMPKKVAREILADVHGRSLRELPERARPKRVRRVR